MRKLLAAALISVLCWFSSFTAEAQTPGGASCQYIAYGAVLTPAQWNYCFQIKQDFIGYVPVNKAGDTMLGELITTASTSLNAGFNVQPGTGPSVPANGDIWISGTGMFVRIAGVTYQLATASGGPLIVTSNSANALAVGPNGATNPSFNVDASTASAANGLNVKSSAAGAGVALTAISSATNENLSIDAKGTGTIGIGSNSASAINLGNVSTGSVTVLSPSVVFTGASATSLVVGPNGSTNPTLKIDDSTVSAATGLLVKSAAAAAGIALSAISSGANENLTLDAKGSGSVKINTVGTGGFGFNVGSDATNDMYYRNSSGLLTRIPIGVNTNVLTISGGIPSWQAGTSAASITVGTTTIVGGTSGRIEFNNAGVLGEVAPGNGLDIAAGTLELTAARRTLPTKQVFTTGSGTYTTPANVLWIEIDLIGGGSGGGAGNSATLSTAGGNTCWNTTGAACTTPVYQAGGGQGSSNAVDGAGGVVSGSGTCDWSAVGQQGGTNVEAQSGIVGSTGGTGGATSHGGGGAPGLGGSSAGTAAGANTGAGGGGGGQGNAATAFSGFGGSGGATCHVIINTPAATYTYAVGAGGAGATPGGTGGGVGGAGAAGLIVVYEHYGS